MSFINLIAMPAKFDFHIHTYYSDGRSGPLEMVEAAEARDLEAVAITDHGPELHVGVPREKLVSMLQDIETARRDAGIPVYAGIEANVVDGSGRVDIDEEFAKKLDLCIVSIHALGELMDPKQVAREYLARMTKAVTHRKFNVLGHPFFYHQNLLPYLSREEIENFVKLMAHRDIAVEVNMKYRGPGDEFLALCLREGVKFSIGSDAHTPRGVGKIDWALSALRRVGARREDLILDDMLR
ncbi:MAG TPA: PHP domain-containing protein [Hadesarchaea archaeon]|nr:PHP domain-containing protein [Hadesarchaea archaeon]